jgi:DNA-directed RNA polymerase subunit RPC12/RpoP
VSKNPIMTHWAKQMGALCGHVPPAGKQLALTTNRMKLRCQHCRQRLMSEDRKAAQNPMTLVRRWWNTARRFNDDER